MLQAFILLVCGLGAAFVVLLLVTTIVDRPIAHLRSWVQDAFWHTIAFLVYRIEKNCVYCAPTYRVDLESDRKTWITYACNLQLNTMGPLKYPILLKLGSFHNLADNEEDAFDHLLLLEVIDREYDWEAHDAFWSKHEEN